MSALAQNGTLQGDGHMSALPQKSDITEVVVDQVANGRVDPLQGALG
jgi:hypothetical protein